MTDERRLYLIWQCQQISRVFAFDGANGRALASILVEVLENWPLARIETDRPRRETGSVRSKPERPEGQRPDTVTPSSQDTDQ